jgi:Cu2+-exporting ATPase
LQEQGKTVCFIGDGINDSIAMKKADVSISLSGATDIAVDVAQVVLLDGSLSRLCDIFDIAEKLKTNSKRTFGIIIAGTAINFAGIFLLHFGITATVVINMASLIFGGVNSMIPLNLTRTKSLDVSNY